MIIISKKVNYPANRLWRIISVNCLRWRNPSKIFFRKISWSKSLKKGVYTELYYQKHRTHEGALRVLLMINHQYFKNYWIKITLFRYTIEIYKRNRNKTLRSFTLNFPAIVNERCIPSHCKYNLHQKIVWKHDG